MFDSEWFKWFVVVMCAVDALLSFSRAVLPEVRERPWQYLAKVGWYIMLALYVTHVA